ncbi:MAG: hypothetical protein ACRC7S_18710 [Cetobacterium sp.]
MKKIDNEFTNQITELENGWIETPHGIFTPNEHLGLSAYEVYERYVYDLENPPIPKPTLEEVVEEQANKISILEVENVNLLESQKVQDRTIVENDMRMIDLEFALEDLIISTNPIVLKYSETRSEVYFNQLSQMIKMENYDSKEDMKRILDKYLKGKRITQEEYDRLYNMLYNHA